MWLPNRKEELARDETTTIPRFFREYPGLRQTLRFDFVSCPKFSFGKIEMRRIAAVSAPRIGCADFALFVSHGEFLKPRCGEPCRHEVAGSAMIHGAAADDLESLEHLVQPEIERPRDPLEGTEHRIESTILYR